MRLRTHHRMHLSLSLVHLSLSLVHLSLRVRRRTAEMEVLMRRLKIILSETMLQMRMPEHTLLVLNILLIIVSYRITISLMRI